MTDKPSQEELERHRQASDLFDELVDAGSEVRRQRLAEVRQSDPVLADQVEALLGVDSFDSRLLGGLGPLGDRGAHERRNEAWALPDNLGRYELRGVLGDGGMGRVMRAWDTQLKREVALKVFPDDLSEERRSRFVAEARSLAALNHPGVVQVHSVEEVDERLFFTMQLVEGTTLDEQIALEGLPLDHFFRWARELAEALAAAHERGIVHRDLKPANVMVESSGRLVLVDFGLVKRLASDIGALGTAAETLPGQVMGTIGYMSPEQAKGESVDERSDVFSLGVVLYEMLTGTRPFQRSSAAEALAATLSEPHQPIRQRRAEVPPALAHLLHRCLQKGPDARPQNAREVARELERLAEYYRGRGRRRTLLVATVGLLTLTTIASLVTLRNRAKDRQIARGLQQIETLQGERRWWEAFLQTSELLEREPELPDAHRLFEDLTVRTGISTEPPGARASVRAYEQPNGPWLSLGETPIEERDLANDVLVLRLEADGFQPLEVQYAPRRGQLHLDLQPLAESPTDMVQVPLGGVVLSGQEPLRVDAFWIDRLEVSNDAYLRFVRAGGYDRLARDHGDGHGFVDQTGRPGPANWSVGAYPAEEGDLPVRGVSWFEAAAYCESIGKRLPSLPHWRRAAPERPSNHMARRSNFNSDAPLPVGTSRAISPTGAIDLAGNVTEWIANEIGDERYTIGGSWRDPRYSFDQAVRRSPHERSDTVGFRCVSAAEGDNERLYEPLAIERIDFGQIEPASEEVYGAYLRLFESDPTPLDSELISTDDSSPYWIRQRVSYRAVYGDDQIPAELFLPKGVEPPYQVVVYFPSASALNFDDSSQLADLPFVDFLPRSGRAFLVPVYEGLYQRRTERLGGPNALKQRWIHIFQDLRQSVEFVIAHPDLDQDRMAYASLSLGSVYAPIALTVEPRFQAAVLIAGGFGDDGMHLEPPEINPWNYAPRVTTPVLMINGGGDGRLPVETAQRPMFELFGTPEEHKKHVILEGGSLPDDQNAITRSALDWLDLYLGPVKRQSERAGEALR